jgi:hypothetical protein
MGSPGLPGLFIALMERRKAAKETPNNAGGGGGLAAET